MHRRMVCGGRRERAALKALKVSDGKLRLLDRELPSPVFDQVLVAVAGAGLNRADILQASGAYPALRGWPSDIPGLEFAGVVEATGTNVTSLNIGERVFGIVGGGGHASHLLTRESLCVRVPDSLDVIDAGGVPETFITAHDAMVVQAGLRAGERVLIHGVGSGVGTAALQLAKACGAAVVGTSRTPVKLERCKDLGLDDAVLAGEGMAQRIGEVDVVIDLVGGPYLKTDLEACRPKGRVVLVGMMAGAVCDLDLGVVLRKRLMLRGTVLRARAEYEKAAATEAFAAEVVPLLARSVIRPVVDRKVPLAQAEEAYALMHANETFGKVVLVPDDVE